MPALRPVAVVAILLLSGVAGGSAIAGAQESLVTLTVSVATPSGDPIGNALLTASWSGGSRSGTTASNGKVFIDVPADADVEITMQHPDYVRNFPFVVRDASERDVSITAHEKGSVTVTVEDGDGPVEGANVVLRRSGRLVVSATTDADGVIESGTVESETYDVQVSKAGYYTQETTIDVGDASTETVTVRRGTVTLEVNVTDDHFDPPRAVEGATANVEGSGSVTTQPTGIGRISVPVNAWARVEVTKEDYSSAGDSVFVGEEDVEVPLTIQRLPSLSIELLTERVVIGERAALTVVDEYGDPVADVAVLVDGEEVARTDADGRAVVRIESEGPHDVVVRQDSLEASTEIVGIREGADTTTAGTTTDESAETETDLPGFGVGVAVLGLLLAVLLARRR